MDYVFFLQKSLVKIRIMIYNTVRIDNNQSSKTILYLKKGRICFMRKTMKKVVALATATVMTFAMGVTAFGVNIVTLAGSMNDWSETDMNAKLTDDDGDGILSYTTTLAAGDYMFKMIVDGSWTPDGMSNNYGITVAADTEVTFWFNPNSTNKYQYTATGAGVTVNTDCNRADAEKEGKDPEEIKGVLEAAAADAASWVPAGSAATEDTTAAEETTAAEADTTAAADTTADKDATPATGDALSLSIVMIGAVAAVAFVASRKKADA